MSTSSFVDAPTIEQPAQPSYARLFATFLVFVLAASFNLTLLSPYLVGLLVWGRPRTVPRLAQIARYIRLPFTVHPPPPGLSIQARSYILLLILIKAACIPLWGLAWHLDELLYGRRLDDPSVAVVKPIFVISAGRTGSTQFSRYIESDPFVEAPSLIRCFFPYIWLWRIVSSTVGLFLTSDDARAKLMASISPEMLERHELDPMKADTFDAPFYTYHMNYIAPTLGPDVFADDMNMARANPTDSPQIKDDFVRVVDRLGRKHLLMLELDPQKEEDRHCEEEPRRFFLKGHFLFAASALEQKYPDASFLTLVRDPASRLRSCINYMRIGPSDPGLGPTPWAWLATALLRTEEDYCRVEMEWFSRRKGDGIESATEAPAKRCVVQMEDFISDLEGTMKWVYRQCLGREGVSAHVPRVHASRRRSDYSVDRALNEVGIDGATLQNRLQDYITWCKSHSLKKE